MTLPVTKDIVSPKTEEKIRERVRRVESIQRPDGTSDLVTLKDVDGLYGFFALPEISGPIYTIHKPVTPESVARHIDRKLKAHEAGEGFMVAKFDEDGTAFSYLDYTIWPQWSVAEFCGAVRPDRRAKGQGRAGMISNIDFVFDTLGIYRLCFTSALDNARSIELIDAMGMTRMGEITSTGPDGAKRQSLVWEMTGDEWRAHKTND